MPAQAGLPAATAAQAGAAACVHFVGVAGIGMSALADILRRRGCTVTGSDRCLDLGAMPAGSHAAHPRLDKLRHAGVALYPQDGSGVGPATARLVVSTAIEDDNPDVAGARRRGLEIVHRSDLLAELFHQARRRVAVTGSCGKTTVTAMAGWILHHAGLQPTVINGGVMRNFESDDAVGNAVAGAGDLAVIEADESDGTCTRYRPTVAVVTGIARDHKEAGDLLGLYRRFLDGTQGVAVLNADDAELRPLLCEAAAQGEARVLAPPPGLRRLTFGLHEGAAVRGEDVSCGADSCRFRVAGTSFALPCIGVHNVLNALAALAAVRALGVEDRAAADALAGFRSVARRLEVVGSPRGARVYDDYAHSPAKIAAALSAVRAAGASRVLAVFQPHGFSPARFMRAELAETWRSSLRPGDRAFLLPIYYAGGTVTRDISSDQLAEDARAAGAPVESVASAEALPAILAAAARPGDAVLVMGARDDSLTELARVVVHAIESACLPVGMADAP